MIQHAQHASAALVRFDTELGDRVAAFAPVLLRSEAAASSHIEHLTASARRILTAEITRTGTSNATLIAANTRAMKAPIAFAGDLSATSIQAMHRVLLESEPRHTPGKWRTEQVWIGTSASSPVGADYVAPACEWVPALIEDLIAFSRRDHVPALIQVTLAHAQFETIHPFTDGNGRTGRAYAQSMGREERERPFTLDCIANPLDRCDDERFPLAYPKELMAQKYIVQLVDDLTNEPIEEGAGQSVQFSLDGVNYTIDLSDEHAQELRGSLDLYVAAARKADTATSRSGRGSASRTASASKADLKRVRDWAAKNGYTVSGRGRIPANVQEAYAAAR